MNPQSEQVQRDPRRDGFTLIDLLIVIVILGILATVVVFAVGGISEQGELSACDTDERTLATAVEAHFGEFGTTVVPSSGLSADDYETTLKNVGFLHGVSRYWDVDAAGSSRLRLVATAERSVAPSVETTPVNRSDRA